MSDIKVLVLVGSLRVASINRQNDKPLAVVGAALGQYGGVWAHDEARTSFGIAGPRVVEDLKLSVQGAAPVGTWAPRALCCSRIEHPSDVGALRQT